MPHYYSGDRTQSGYFNPLEHLEAYRAWWLEVQVLKSHGDKSRRKNDKGPQDMEIDCIKNVTTDLSAKACQTKDVLTEVDHPLSSAKTSESCFRSPCCD